VQQADRAEVARALADAATRQLRPSYARTMFTGLPEHIVSKYQRRFPAVEITADSGTSGSNVDRLRSGEVDIAFVLTPPRRRGRSAVGSTSARNRSWSLCPVGIH
jgi:DNA-binding transcriptional LysR family regulator